MNKENESFEVFESFKIMRLICLCIHLNNVLHGVTCLIDFHLCQKKPHNLSILCISVEKMHFQHCLLPFDFLFHFFQTFLWEDHHRLKSPTSIFSVAKAQKVHLCNSFLLNASTWTTCNDKWELHATRTLQNSFNLSCKWPWKKKSYP